MKITGKRLFEIMQEAAKTVFGAEFVDDKDRTENWNELNETEQKAFNAAAELIEKQAE